MHLIKHCYLPRASSCPQVWSLSPRTSWWSHQWCPSAHHRAWWQWRCAPALTWFWNKAGKKKVWSKNTQVESAGGTTLGGGVTHASLWHLAHAVVGPAAEGPDPIAQSTHRRHTTQVSDDLTLTTYTPLWVWLTATPTKRRFILTMCVVQQTDPTVSVTVHKVQVTRNNFSNLWDKKLPLFYMYLPTMCWVNNKWDFN